MTRIAIFGAGGFIGRSVVARSTELGLPVTSLPRLDFDGAGTDGPAMPALVERWLEANPVQAEGTVEAMRGTVVINAAGLASSDAAESRELFLLNTFLPVLAGRLAAEAGCTRFIHVSSAAVQGRMDPLDETERVQPFSPYSRSKAQAEHWLLGGELIVPSETVIYRPTSVQGADRSVTRSLLRLASLPVALAAGRQSPPLPVCLVENVAKAIVHLATLDCPCPRICLQPAEAMTTGLVFDAFGGPRRTVSIPAPAAGWALQALRAIPRTPRIEARLRHLELLVRGQRIDAHALELTGFRPSGGVEAYRSLAAQVRATS